jgi:hypothetical protein
LTSSRVAPSDRAGPGWVPGWRLKLADHLVAVRSWLLHEPDLGLAKDDGVRDWRGTRQRVNRPSRFGQESPISGVVERYCVIPFLLPPPKNPCPTRAEEASQAGRRRFDPGRPLCPKPLCDQGLSGAKHLRLASGENGSRVAREDRAAATCSARTRRAASSTSMPQSSRPPVPPHRPRRLGRGRTPRRRWAARARRCPNAAAPSHRNRVAMRSTTAMKAS